MPKKKDQKATPTPTTDSERESRVLFEEVRSELKVVAEGHTSVVGCLDKIEGRLDKVEDGLQEVKGGLQEVKGRLSNVEGQLGQLQNQVGSVLTDHEHRLKTVEQKLEAT